MRFGTEPRDTELAEALSALGSPTRLALLRELRTPKALREIVVKSDAPGADHPRTISRQAVREHLDRLLEQGVVVAREAERAYGETLEYVVNHQALYGLAEEFRALARLRPAEEPTVDTVKVEPPATRFRIRGPALVLVKGLDEGRVFDLTPLGDRGAWIIGRKRDADVPLDFDPFVSRENSQLTCREGAYLVDAVPGSRNGTWLNFQPVTPGEPQRLETGDVIGAGRSLLLFRA